MMIRLDLVDYNPYRDLDLDPIDESRVAALASNVNDLGFWGGIAVRPDRDRYQLAFGHHRLEALRGLGWTEADLTFVEFDDFQMVKAMHRENALQRKGVLTALESVGAAIRVLGPAILERDEDEVRKIFRTSLGRSAVANAKDSLKKGHGIGPDLIQSFFKANSELEQITLGDIREAKATLVDNGKMREYMDEMQTKVDDALVEAARMAAEKLPEAKLDPRCTALFADHGTSVWRAVRRKITSEGFLSLHPVEYQLTVCAKLLEWAEDRQREEQGEKFDGLRLTADGKDPFGNVTSLLGSYIYNGGRWLKTIRSTQEVQVNEAVNAYRRVVTSCATIQGNVSALIQAIHEEQNTPEDIDFGPDFQAQLQATIDALNDLANAAGRVVSIQ